MFCPNVVSKCADSHKNKSKVQSPTKDQMCRFTQKSPTPSPTKDQKCSNQKVQPNTKVQQPQSADSCLGSSHNQHKVNTRNIRHRLIGSDF